MLRSAREEEGDGIGADRSGNGLEYRTQPTPLDFDLVEIEGFRYRGDKFGRSLATVAVRMTQAAAIKVEILNSRRVEGYFDSNTNDMKLLIHDWRTTHVSKVQDYLK